MRVPRVIRGCGFSRPSAILALAATAGLVACGGGATDLRTGAAADEAGPTAPSTPLVPVTPPGGRSEATATTSPPASDIPPVSPGSDADLANTFSEVPTWDPAFPGFGDAVADEHEPWVHVSLAPYAIAEQRTTAYAAGDRAALLAAWSPGAGGAAADLAALDALVAAGQRRADEGLVIEEAAAVWFTDTEALVRVVHSHGPERVVDSAGVVAEVGPGWPPEEDWWLLDREPGGAHPGVGWRLVAWLDEPPQEQG